MLSKKEEELNNLLSKYDSLIVEDLFRENGNLFNEKILKSLDIDSVRFLLNEKSIKKTEDMFITKFNIEYPGFLKIINNIRPFKIEIAYELRKYFKEKEDEYSLYFDSGMDIELPILSGSKKIIMCDIIFISDEMKNNIIQKISEYGKVNIKDNIIYLNSEKLGKIEIILLDNNENNLKVNYKIGMLYGVLKHPMNMELFEIKGLKNQLQEGFHFVDNRSQLKPSELENIGFIKKGNYVYSAGELDKILSYNSYNKEKQFGDFKLGKGKTLNLSDYL